jgi:hypothetical protein
LKLSTRNPVSVGALGGSEGSAECGQISRSFNQRTVVLRDADDDGLCLRSANGGRVRQERFGFAAHRQQHQTVEVLSVNVEVRLGPVGELS